MPVVPRDFFIQSARHARKQLLVPNGDGNGIVLEDKPAGLVPAEKKFIVDSEGRIQSLHVGAAGYLTRAAAGTGALTFAAKGDDLNPVDPQHRRQKWLFSRLGAYTHIVVPNEMPA